jgi:hypothetical protein
MNLKRKLVNFILLAILACLVFFWLPTYSGLFPAYDVHVYYPLQVFRGWLLSQFPFSIGDVLYFIAGFSLLVTIIKWVGYLFSFRRHKERLAASLLHTINTILAVYLVFMISWGANYYKPALIDSWALTPTRSVQKTTIDTAETKKLALENLITFDRLLVSRLNAYAPHYHTFTLRQLNDRAKSYYYAYTDSKLRTYGVGIKPTLYGYFIERLGVEGYYNPFTGEGQINKGLPAFTMPFLICHEMAHQAGIASEEDANLMAYALGTLVPDSTFRYSCYLNIWLYANNRLYRRDSTMAIKFESELNQLTIAHIDTLDDLSQKYQNQYARASSDLYDNYLKLHDQKDGIKSYGNVVNSAWLLEQKRKSVRSKTINIPF